MTGRTGLVGVVMVAATLLAGCGTGAGGDEPERTTVNVLAAASLEDVFTELEGVFEAEHPTADLEFQFAGSSTLAQQIVEGAPADVFASANERQMSVVADEGLVDGQPRLFATNRLTIAVAPGNPKRIRGFADLARQDVITVVCASEVPCGAATEQVERSTRVTLSPASEETEVSGVLNRVVVGEADAGVVYVTDVRGARGDVDSVDIPESADAINDYPIARIADAPAADLATAFVDFVLGERGRRALTDAGFGAPGG